MQIDIAQATKVNTIKVIHAITLSIRELIPSMDVTEDDKVVGIIK